MWQNFVSTWKTFTIAVIPGDGVGREVAPRARRVLERAAQKH
jgi:isocitrate/isopropylmalate dehydrogenase